MPREKGVPAVVMVGVVFGLAVAGAYVPATIARSGTQTVPVVISSGCVGSGTGQFDRGGLVNVTNSNAHPVTVGVTRPDGSTTSATLESGASGSFDGLPDGDYTVETGVNGSVIATETVTIDCESEAEQPDPGQVSATCVAGTAGITVTNPNDDTTVTVDLRETTGASLATVELGPGESVTFGNWSDGDYTVETGVNGSVVATETVTIDCERDRERVGPVLAPDPQCVEGGLTVTIDCGPGENTTTRVTTTTLTTTTAANEGEQPEPVSTATDCLDFGAAPSGRLLLRNFNAQPIRVTVTEPNGSARSLTIASDVTRILERLPDGDYAVETGVNGSVVATEVVTVDCDAELVTTTAGRVTTTTKVTTTAAADGAGQPDPVQASPECVDGEGQITVTNSDDTTVSVTLREPAGQLLADVELGPGGTDAFTNLTDGNYTVETGVNGSVIATETITIDCEENQPSRTRLRLVADATEVTPGELNEVRFTVTDGNESSVPDATVRVDGRSGTTNEAGEVTLTLEPAANREGGLLTATATKSNTSETAYLPDRVELSVDARSELQSISISLGEPNLAEGGATRPTVLATYDNGSRVDVTDRARIAVGNDRVATVDGSTVIAVGEGSTEITAKLDDETASVALTVEPEEREEETSGNAAEAASGDDTTATPGETPTESSPGTDETTTVETETTIESADAQVEDLVTVLAVNTL